MNIAMRRVTTALASTGLLVGAGIATAEAASAYHGKITFGAPTVSRTCDPSSHLPTQVSYSVAYDATQANSAGSAPIYAQFTSDDGTDTKPPSTIINATSTQDYTITPGQSGTITGTVDVPAGATALPNVEVGFGSPNDPIGSAQTFRLSCAAGTPEAIQFQIPTIASISNPCLGTTTVRLSNASSSEWDTLALTGNPNVMPGFDFLYGHTSKVINIGSALRGAETFELIGFSDDAASQNYVNVPLLMYSKACTPGRPATTLTGVRKGTRNVLTATVKPGFGGAAVKFYRLAGTKRVLVGTAKTGPAGKAVLSAPRRANTKYVAVVGATHWSVATTTPTRLVR